MLGYYKNPEDSARVLTGGWLRTGDLGFLDEDGFLSVQGRIRSLLISDAGEKYSPEEIEETILGSTELIDQIMVWCDHKKYSCALVSLDQNKVQRFITKNGITSAESLCTALQEEFFAFKKDPKAKKVQSAWVPGVFQILGTPFSEKDGTINSTMKIVRYKVSELYKDSLEYSYTKEGSQTLNPKNLATLRELFKLS